MFYTKTAKIISAIILFMGITRVAMGFLVANSGNPKLAATEFLGNHTSGEAIDKGFLYIFIAIVLGVLVEISINIQKRNSEKSKHK
ncbi:MAG: hypothetical protein LGB78_09875 [Sulfurovum sp.]|nr:hypothetical protein [Sulfurovum sp.]MCB4764183.1 hypothetical protein [Sulfurovum sp.]MCB4773318.1 hypothetical protein [Sulfurovum sp.]MCB4778314.1 hypothetical protein [Sulfurovum sp.]MCB4781045.1 hypothetical protein [Sulfurovum sp.]